MLHEKKQASIAAEDETENIREDQCRKHNLKF
jgi:hypothetical protein